MGKLRLLLLLEEEQDGRRCPPRAEEEEEEEEEEAVGFADDAAEEEEKSRRSAALCIGPFPKRALRVFCGEISGKKNIFWTRRALFSLPARARAVQKTLGKREREREGTVAVVLYAVHVHFVLVVSGVVERREKTDIRFGKQRGFHHASADCFRYDDDKDKRDDGTTNASGR